MNENATARAYHLTLDGLTVNPRLARRLAAVVACRYHALPVAEDNGLITVVMADPDDPVAREAVMSALGAPSYVVRGTSAAIDALLTELWPQADQRCARLLVCTQANPHRDCAQAPVNANEVLHFAQALGDLLDASVAFFRPETAAPDVCDALVLEADRFDYDLVVWGEPMQTPTQQVMGCPAYCRAIERLRTSLLIARQPRLPLRRLLLIIGGEEIDNVAVHWAVRLAKPSGAVVTILAIVPPVSAMHDGWPPTNGGMEALLTTRTSVGRQIRCVGQCLKERDVAGRLRLRQGEPLVEIQREVATGDYDLITVTATSHDQRRHLLQGDVVVPLMRWAGRPVLVAKSPASVPGLTDI